VAQEANAGGGADEAFDVAELAYLKQIVDSNPTMMLDKLVYHMYYHTGKYVEISTMRRVLHRGGYVNLQIKERMLRGPAFMAGAGRQEAAFTAFQQKHHAQEMVFFDETAAVERKIARRRGYGEEGEKLYSYVPLPMRRGQSGWTPAATMTVNGQGPHAVTAGSLNREKFLALMGVIMPTMNRHWGLDGRRTFLLGSILVEVVPHIGVCVCACVRAYVNDRGLFLHTLVFLSSCAQNLELAVSLHLFLPLSSSTIPPGRLPFLSVALCHPHVRVLFLNRCRMCARVLLHSFDGSYRRSLSRTHALDILRMRTKHGYKSMYFTNVRRFRLMIYTYIFVFLF